MSLTALSTRESAPSASLAIPHLFADVFLHMRERDKIAVGGGDLADSVVKMFPEKVSTKRLFINFCYRVLISPCIGSA